MKKKNTIPAVFKSATFIFLCAVLALIGTLFSLGSSPVTELWFALSMNIAALVVVGFLVACVYRDKSTN